MNGRSIPTRPTQQRRQMQPWAWIKTEFHFKCTPKLITEIFLALGQAKDTEGCPTPMIGPAYGAKSSWSTRDHDEYKIEYDHGVDLHL